MIDERIRNRITGLELLGKEFNEDFHDAFIKEFSIFYDEDRDQKVRIVFTEVDVSAFRESGRYKIGEAPLSGTVTFLLEDVRVVNLDKELEDWTTEVDITLCEEGSEFTNGKLKMDICDFGATIICGKASVVSVEPEPCRTLQKFVTDDKTDTVCISGLFTSEVDSRLDGSLRDAIKRWADSHGISVKTLRNTKDIWARDYMPVQIAENRYIFGKYDPDYVEEKKYLTDWTDGVKADGLDVKDICKEFIPLTFNDGTPVITDGGNFIKAYTDHQVPCLICCDKIIQENMPREEGDDWFYIDSAEQTGVFITFVPWEDSMDTPIEDRVNPIGHADGIVRYVAPGELVMTNIRDFDPEFADRIIEKLKYSFPTIHELSFGELRDVNPKSVEEATWSYINFLQVGKHILIPSLGCRYDAMALEQLKAIYEPHGISVEQVDINMFPIISPQKMEENGGGALNCLTWTVKMGR